MISVKIMAEIEGLEIVYVKDAAGNNIRMGEVVYNGEKLHFPEEFSYMATKLDVLEQFEMRSDDIWMLTYPKSGIYLA